MNQREAVYVTTMNVLADNNISFDDGQEGGVEKVVTKEIRASVIGVVVQGFLSGEVEMSAEGKTKYFSDPKKLKSYVNGLVSNWYRKDERLNGNVKHVIAKPGSRAGVGDDQIKALKALRATKADDAEALKAIDAAIELRKSEIKPKAVELTDAMLALIPAELKAKLNI
jgi:hypothetical protein